MGKSFVRILNLIFYISLVVCGVCRIILKLKYIDHGSGFYAGGGVLVILFNAVLLVAVLLLFCMTRLRKASGDYRVRQNNRFGAAICLLSGSSVIAFTVSELPDTLASYEGVNLLGLISGYGSSILGFGAGIALLVMGTMSFLGKEQDVNPLLLLCPSLWQLLLLISKFNSYATITTISDHMLTVMFMLFNTLFLFGHARTVCGLGRNDGRNYSIPAGFCSALFGLLLVVPNYIYMLASRSIVPPVSTLSLLQSAYILLLSVYAVSFVHSVTRSIRVV